MKVFISFAVALAFAIPFARGKAGESGHHVYVSTLAGLSVIDAGDSKTVATIPLPGQAKQIEIGGGGRYIYIATIVHEKKNGIAVVDMAQRKIVRTIDADASAGFALADDTRKLYIAGANIASVEVRSADDGALLKSISLPGQAESLAITPAKQAIYVTSSAHHEIIVVDTATQDIGNRIALPATPRCVAFSPDGSRIYVACEEPAQVIAIDGSGKILNRIELSNTSLKPTRLLASADGSRLFLSTVQGAVQTIDTAASRVVGQSPVSQNVTAMALSPDGKSLVMSDSKADAIEILDSASFQMTSTLPGAATSCIATGPRVGGGVLRWETRDAEVTLAKGQTTVNAKFRFVNTSDKPVTLVGLSTSCRCTTAQSSKPADSAGKFIFAARESASIDATINVGTHHGRITKTITALLDDPREPSVQLVMSAIIPEESALASSQAEPAAAHMEGAKRSLTDIYFDLEKMDVELQKLQPDAQAYITPAHRAEIAPSARPLMKRMLALYDQVIQAEPGNRPQVEPARFRLLSLLSLMDDREAADYLSQLAKEGSVSAQAAQLTVRWWRANSDATAQTAVLDDLRVIGKKNPADTAVLYQIVTMMREGPASRDVKEHAEDIVLTDLTGDSAKQVVERIQIDRRCRAMEGKPFVAQGKTIDEKPFSTADWKGKVVAVHFWAPWCKPCVKQLPDIERVYAAYHDKGFEIVGVSCESKLALLNNFLAQQKDMPWPELIRKGAPGDFHPLAIKYGMDMTGVPQIYLIDRKGILRTVDGTENLEAMVKKLLSETP